MRSGPVARFIDSHGSEVQQGNRSGHSRVRSTRNEPFGSRPEPGADLIASILQLTPGEVPEGKAGVRHQSTGLCAEALSKAAAGNGRYLTNRSKGLSIPPGEPGLGPPPRLLLPRLR